MSVSGLTSADVLSAAAANAERTVTTVWPSIAAGVWGRWLGRVYANRWGVRIGGVPLTLGWLAVALSAPLAALLYVAGKAPRRPFLVVGPVNPDAVRYRITNRNVLVEHPLERSAEPVASVALADFDEVILDELPGQAWFHAADVVLRRNGAEVLRLAGVPRPEPFVQTLIKTQRALAG